MNNPKPKIYNNDIKVLGRVVSIASENKLAAAEQIFDEKFKYNELPDYSFDNENIDPTQKGLNQYSINRLIGKKVKSIEDNGLVPDENGYLGNIKANNITVGNKLTTKDLEVTNNARINNLVVGPGEGIDVYKALTHLLQCCENMNNQGGSSQGGVTLVVSPNPINMNVGDTVEFTVKLNAGGVDLVVDPEINYTASISDTSVATLIGNNKVKAVSGGRTTQLTVLWNGIQKTVQINVAQPTSQEPETPAYWTVTYNPNINDNTMPVSTETVEDGHTAPGRTLSKDGYTFNGWTLNSSAYDFNTPVHSNITLMGSWTLNEQPTPLEPTKYTITYKDGETILDTQEYAAGSQITPIASPSKLNHTFTGWDGMPSVMPAENVIVYARWAEIVEPQPGIQYVESVVVTKSHNNNLQWSNDNTEIPSDRTSVTLTATVNPDNAYNRNVEWSCSDNTKVTLTPNGNTCVVTAKADTSSNGIKVWATSVGTKEDETTARGEATIVVDLVTTPGQPTTQYKVSWSVSPNGSANVLNAVTENGAYFTPSEVSWNNWQANISVNSPYILDSVVVMMGDQNITSTAWDSPIISIPKTSITADVTITITAHENVEQGTWSVDYSGVLNNHAHVNANTVIPATCNSTPGTVNKGSNLLMFIIADSNYEFSGQTPVTVTIGGVDVTNEINSATGKTYVYASSGLDTDLSQAEGYAVLIPSVSGNVVITASTSQVSVPVSKHTITWLFTGDGEHASLVNMSPQISNGGQVDEGSHWTAKIQPATGYNAYLYNLKMRDSNNQWLNLYSYATLGGSSSYYDATEFTVNINNVSGDVEFDVYTEEKPQITESNTIFRNDTYPVEVELDQTGESYTISKNLIALQNEFDELGNEVTQNMHTQGTAVFNVPIYLQEGLTLNDLTISYNSSQVPSWLNVSTEKVASHQFATRYANSNDSVNFELPSYRVTFTLNEQWPMGGFNEEEFDMTISNNLDNSEFAIVVKRVTQYYLQILDDSINNTISASGSENEHFGVHPVISTILSNDTYNYQFENVENWNITVSPDESWVTIGTPEVVKTDSNDTHWYNRYPVSIGSNSTGTARSATITITGTATIEGVNLTYYLEKTIQQSA